MRTRWLETVRDWMGSLRERKDGWLWRKRRGGGGGGGRGFHELEIMGSRDMNSIEVEEEESMA